MILGLLVLWRSFLKVFTIIEHGGHHRLGHVTCTIHINFVCNLPLIGQAVSEKKVFENNGHIHVYSPGAEADTPLPLGSNVFIYGIIQSI